MTESEKVIVVDEPSSVASTGDYLFTLTGAPRTCARDCRPAMTSPVDVPGVVNRGRR